MSKIRQGTKNDAVSASVTSCFNQASGQEEVYWGFGSPSWRPEHIGFLLCSFGKSPHSSREGGGGGEEVVNAVHSCELARLGAWRGWRKHGC